MEEPEGTATGTGSPEGGRPSPAYWVDVTLTAGLIIVFAAGGLLLPVSQALIPFHLLLVFMPAVAWVAAAYRDAASTRASGGDAGAVWRGWGRLIKRHPGSLVLTLALVLLFLTFLFAELGAYAAAGVAVPALLLCGFFSLGRGVAWAWRSWRKRDASRDEPDGLDSLYRP